MSSTESVKRRDTIVLGAAARRLAVPALGVAAVGLLAAVLGGMGDLARLQRAYLTAFMYVLSIGLGALWFVVIQHLTSARWSVVVRRVAEILAGNMPLLWLLSLGVVLPMFLGSSDLYVWLDHDKVHSDHLLEHKAPYLNVGFFTVRWLAYFGLWTWFSWRFFKLSVRQDAEGGQALSDKLQRLSAPAMILFALTLTFCAIDLLMSLEALWFSTIFGVYYFAGCVLAGYSTLALSLVWLQRAGCLVHSVNREHYHDIGKMMFAFTVFWAYIGFSQFMLIWYADVPEETHWYHQRFEHGWEVVSAVLLFAHFVIPFFGLMSRHAKRNTRSLVFWSCWLLLVHYVDLYWLTYPAGGGHIAFGLPEIGSLFAVVGVFVGVTLLRAQNVSLLAKGDPRLPESLAFENY